MSSPAAVPAAWSEALARLAKQVAFTLPRALLLSWLLIGFSALLNLVFAGVFFLSAGLAGGGHGSLIVFPLAVVPFLPFFLAAVVIAHRQALRRLAAAALTSQAEPLAHVTEVMLAGFIDSDEGKAARVSETQTDTRLMARAWRQYVVSRAGLPAPVGFLLARVWAGEPLAALIGDAAKRGISAHAMAAEVTSHLVRRLATRKLAPTPRVTLTLLAANVAGFAILMIAVAKAVR